MGSFDVVKYFSDMGVPYREGGSQYIVKTCPFCGRDDYKLYVDKNTLRFFCFLCESGVGKIFAHFVAELEGISFSRALAKTEHGMRINNVSKNLRLDGDFLLTPYKAEIDPPSVGGLSLPKIPIPFEFYPISDLEPQSLPGMKYCHTRDISQDMIKKYRLMYSVKMKRVIFPVFMGGKCVGWQGRDITGRCNWDKKYPKSKSCKDFKKSHMLYNYDNVMGSPEITIVEGPIDAIKCDDINPVALFGKSLSNVQFTLLRQMEAVKKINIALDPEEGTSIANMGQKLAKYYEVSVISFPMDTDAGDHGPKGIYDLYIKREPWEPYKIY